MEGGGLRVAVVGHVEWVEFINVPRMPFAGEILHGEAGPQLPGGGGAVAAVQLRKLAGEATFFTAFGDDELGRRAAEELERFGVEVRASFRPEPQRRAVTFVDAEGERTITVIGDRLAPSGEDDLGWGDLADFDAVYVTAGDGTALRAARRAGTVVATSRILADLQAARIRLDALVGSAADPAERYLPHDLSPEPHLVVRTEGDRGGTWQHPGSAPRRYGPGPQPEQAGDNYGCGDSFAAALTYSLGKADSTREALAFASECGAAVSGGLGPYAEQLTLP